MADPSDGPSRRVTLTIGIALLVVHATLIASVADALAFTTDEQGYLLAGHAIATDFGFATPQERLHGPLALLANQWFVGDFDPSDLDASRVRGRLGTLPFALLLCVVVWRWASVLWGRRGGLLALGLAALSPNLIAYGGLATVDTAFAATGITMLWLTWRWTTRPTTARAAAVGIAIGACIGTKYLALVLAPTIPLVFVIRALRRGTDTPVSPRRLATDVLVVTVTAWVALHACYGFQASWFSTDTVLQSNVLRGIAEIPVLGHALRVLPEPLVLGADFQAVAARDLSGGFSGSYDPHWAYYLVAVATKATLPMLALFGWGLVTVCRSPRGVPLALWLPLVTLFGYLSLFNNLQIGIRYALIGFPAMALVAGAIWRDGARSPLRRAVVLGAGMWIVGGLYLQWPHYLGYFNPIVGGPGGAYRLFTDSNAEWGQRRVDGERELVRRGVRVLRKRAAPCFGKVGIYVPDLGRQDIENPNRPYHWIRRFQPTDALGSAWLVFEIAEQDFLDAAAAGDRRALRDLTMALVAADRLAEARTIASQHGLGGDLAPLLDDLEALEAGRADAAVRRRIVSRLYAIGCTERALEILREADDAEQTELFLALWSSGDPTAAVELLQERDATTRLDPREALLLAAGLFHLARFEEAVDVLDANAQPAADDPLAPVFESFAQQARQKRDAMRRLRNAGG